MQLKDKATDEIIGKLPNGSIILRCKCFSTLSYRIAKEQEFMTRSLSELVREYQECILYKNSLTKDELEEVTPKPKFKLSDEATYTLLGYNKTWNIFSSQNCHFIARIGTKKEEFRKTKACATFEEVINVAKRLDGGQFTFYTERLNVFEIATLNTLMK